MGFFDDLFPSKHRREMLETMSKAKELMSQHPMWKYHYNKKLDEINLQCSGKYNGHGIFNSAEEEASSYLVMYYEDYKRKKFAEEHPDEYEAQQRKLDEERRLARIKYETQKYMAEQEEKRLASLPNAVQCPYCKSYNTAKISSTSRIASVAMWGVGSSKIGKQWHCNKCNSDF